MNCTSTLVLNGGTFECHRENKHPGVHMAESGDAMDCGFFPKNGPEKTWEIVFDVKADILAAERRLGRRSWLTKEERDVILTADRWEILRSADPKRESEFRDQVFALGAAVVALRKKAA